MSPFLGNALPSLPLAILLPTYYITSNSGAKRPGSEKANGGADTNALVGCCPALGRRLGLGVPNGLHPSICLALLAAWMRALSASLCMLPCRLLPRHRRMLGVKIRRLAPPKPRTAWSAEGGRIASLFGRGADGTLVTFGLRRSRWTRPHAVAASGGTFYEPRWRVERLVRLASKPLARGTLGR